MFQIIDRDTGWNRLLETIKTAENSYVKAGVIGEKAAKVESEHASGDEPMTNVRLASIHEFGTEHVPERSFIRSSFDGKRAEYIGMLRGLVRGLYTGKATPEKVLGIVGLKMAWDMKARIINGEVTPPNAPATIKRKLAKGRWNKKPSGSPKPLIDTGRLVGSITHGVVIQGGGGTEPADLGGSAFATLGEGGE